jgi:hypothetical protein
MVEAGVEVKGKCDKLFLVRCANCGGVVGVVHDDRGNKDNKPFWN